MTFILEPSNNTVEEPKLGYVKHPHRYSIGNEIDTYVYAFLKSYINYQTYIAEASSKTLCKGIGISEKTFYNSIKRLEKIGALQRIISSKKKVRNRYQFNKEYDYIKYERIPMAFFELKVFNAKQKGFLIMILKYLKGKESDTPFTNYSIITLSEKLGLSYNTVKSRLQFFEKLKYCSIDERPNKHTGRTNRYYVFNKEKLTHLFTILTNVDENDKLIRKDKDKKYEQLAVLLKQTITLLKQHNLLPNELDENFKKLCLNS